MAKRGDQSQVVYVDGDVPQLPIQIGQLLVDSSEISLGNTNLQQCTSQNPLVYEPLQGGYPASPAEVAAGATIVNDRYPYGWVPRYGAVGDGTTDDTAAITEAMEVAAISFGRVHFPCLNKNGQTKYRASSVQVYEGTYVTADNGVLVESNEAGAFSSIFRCVSTMGSATSLAANAVKEAASVQVSSASGLSVGQLVVIRDDTYKFSTSGRNLELNEIAGISGTTITLATRLIGNYTTAASAQLVPAITPARDIKFENVVCSVPVGSKGGAFYFQDAYACDVLNCGSSGQEDQAGVQTWRSAFIRVLGGTYKDGQSQSTPGYGYGIAFGEACHNCLAVDVYTSNVRENSVSLNARFCKFINCECWSPYDNGFNSHADGAENCDFINCSVYSSRSYGFVNGFTGSNAADNNIRFINCESYDSGSYGFLVGADATRENQDSTFINCVAIRPGVTTATNYGFYVTNCTRPKFQNCRVVGASANVRAGAIFATCSDVVWEDGEIRDIPSGWGMIHDNCTGVLIDGVNIISIAGATPGIHATGTPSTKVVIRDNRVDNDTAFTRNSGDVIEFNEYSTKRQNSRGVTSGTVADGGTIAHGCVATPYGAFVSAIGGTATDIVKVSALGGTNITVSIKTPAGAAGTAVICNWQADS